MSLAADYQTATDPGFLASWQMALVSTALAVQAEATSTANHAMRSAYAMRILADPTGFAKLTAFGATVDGNATLATKDANLESRASAIFNAYCVLS